MKYYYYTVKTLYYISDKVIKTKDKFPIVDVLNEIKNEIKDNNKFYSINFIIEISKKDYKKCKKGKIK